MTLDIFLLFTSVTVQGPLIPPAVSSIALLPLRISLFAFDNRYAEFDSFLAAYYRFPDKN